ncbi:uncharacterized protein LOC126776376 isoform X2 [Nymphalis io]|nr:uncharacterized protein LOC126776376 isoform X2 [Nymphalis io]
MFLDECDMFEYNCDNHKAYLKTDQSDCTLKETKSVVTSTINTKEISPSVTAESLNLTTHNIATVNLSTPTIPSASEIPTTIIITSIKSSSRQTKIKNITKITTSTFNATKISTELTTTPISTVVIDSNCTRSNVNKTTNLKMTKAITKNLTKPMSTMLSTQSLTPDSSLLKTDTTKQSKTEMISTLSNLTKSEPNLSTSVVNTSDAITTITTEYKELNENTIGEDVTPSTPDVCRTYPKYCDRPRTWETTVKGETRDFFQILKARFGSRVRLLKDTTHFPQHLNISINDLRISLNEDNESFHYGAHNEG